MKYCYECGTKLIEKESENDGSVQYCPNCQQFRFPIFSTAVSMVIYNPLRDKILLIQQYGKRNNVLVAGYINRGEDAETAVVREVKEEIGINIKDYKFNRSEYFEPTNTLMLNFVCTADSESLENINKNEVDKAQWFSINDAVKNIKPNSLAERFLNSAVMNCE